MTDTNRTCFMKGQGAQPRRDRSQLPPRKMATLIIVLTMLFFLAAAHNAAAQPQKPQPERPLVFVPGILGSRLVDDNGTVIWGDRNSYLNFPKLEIAPSGPVTALHSDGRLVESINVLGPFWTIHQYDTLLHYLHSLGYIDNETLFVFAYDWRLSNFETAKQLQTFVDDPKRGRLQNGQFDLLSHSMGGIVSKLWMVKEGGAARVHKAIYMGTPFQGSMNAFETLSDGWGDFTNFIAGGLPTVRRVALSFPALYELLPTYDKCCRLGSPEKYTPLDVLDVATWRQRDWLPSEYRANGPRGAAFERGLSEARRVGELMRQPIPGVAQVMIAGDYFDTGLYLYVPTNRQSWRDWNFRRSKGDGTVPVWSAANNFSSIEGTEPSFQQHATIFADKYLQNKLERELLNTAPPPVKHDVLGEIDTPKHEKRRLDLARADLSPRIAEPGANATVTVAFEFETGVTRGDVQPTAQLLQRGAADAPITLVETTTDADLAVRRLTFAGSLVAPAVEDTYRIDINVAGQGDHAVFLTVLSAGRRQP
ncbi:hypothetical protein [Bradyrhizobium sp. CCBAU 53421]|uniref:lipase/acyltransferase domain-containing protein n=1 Tax=Bradyrhizobium sp. CCBAU 53421 TaxID=1325120 RepID=UPI00188BE854|nr:hypothetical protein [Bradyrhizobium sp. CCBAU 53421]QOZ36480.1 hypothetical protein XH92_36840 [Bradyrhizobium sp. CCBAU 53421]